VIDDVCLFSPRFVRLVIDNDFAPPRLSHRVESRSSFLVGVFNYRTRDNSTVGWIRGILRAEFGGLLRFLHATMRIGDCDVVTILLDIIQVLGVGRVTGGIPDNIHTGSHGFR